MSREGLRVKACLSKKNYVNLDPLPSTNRESDMAPW